MNPQKLYFKITNAKENHHGFQYCDGLNILTEEFNDDPDATCVTGGFYFTDAEHILEFLEYGIYLREITLPIHDPDFKMVQDYNKWRANKIILGKKYNLCDVSTFKYLKDQGSSFNNDFLLQYASKNKSHPEVIQFSILEGANIHTGNDYAVRLASKIGHLKVVQFLVSNGADIHADNDYAVRFASRNGHLDVVKFLISKGANIHSYNDSAARWASRNGHSEVVKLISEVN